MKGSTSSRLNIGKVASLDTPENELEAMDDDIPDHLVWEGMLREADEQLSKDPHALEPAFKRAQLLWSLGRTDEARLAYVHVLTLSPTHFGAINNLGTLLCSTGFVQDALTCYAEAVAQHPNNPVGHVNLANLLLKNGELDLAGEHYEKALQLNPGHAEAHQGLASLFEKLGDEEKAEHHRRMGFRGKAVTVVPYRGQGQAIEVLVLATATRGNARIQKFLDDHIFHVTVFFMEYCNVTLQLPRHQLIVNIIGNADLCRRALEAAEKIVSKSSAPVINSPSAVLRTGRVSMSGRLRNIPGLVAPLMETFPRSELEAPGAVELLAEHGFKVPFLFRSPGFNNGRNFFKIENKTDLPMALESLPGKEITAIQFLDARGADGKVRKYRVMFIDGKLYPLHLAIADQWKIHYVTADMADNSANRAEEEAFLYNMESVLGRATVTTLQAVCSVLGLEYGGIDFGIGKGGEVLLFESNATMTVGPPGPDERWAYRRAPIGRVLKAINRMILQKARSQARCRTQ